MEVEYRYKRWSCGKCGQPNEPDAWPRCSWCNYYCPNSDVGRMMESDRTPDPWELDASTRTDCDGKNQPESVDGWPVPGCVSPGHT